jgi:hypothetical protein
MSDTIDHERGRKFGQYVSVGTQVTMIYSCDEFFHCIDAFTKRVFNRIDRDKELLNIKTTTEEIRDRRQPADYYLRAVVTSC